MEALSLRRFYFVRHGETDWNLENRFQGQNDIPLNENGQKQAHEATIVLVGSEVDLIYSSHLSRALQTAHILATGFLSVPDVFVVPELAECKSEITARLIYSGLGRTCHPSFSCVRHESETPNEFLDRIATGIRIISDTVVDRQTPLIVGHGGTYWAICQLLGSKPGDLPNCRPIKFEFDNGIWSQEILWN